jgi:hypothetical protein
MLIVGGPEQGPVVIASESNRVVRTWAIEKRALAEGLPYQTLIASLLHKYASGRLREI